MLKKKTHSTFVVLFEPKRPFFMRSHLSKNCQQKAIFDIKEREPQTSNECFNQQTVIKISPLEKKPLKKLLGI